MVESINGVAFLRVCALVGSCSVSYVSCKHLLIPRPSCWMVKMEGVGAVYECPKKGGNPRCGGFQLGWAKLLILQTLS